VRRSVFPVFQGYQIDALQLCLLPGRVGDRTLWMKVPNHCEKEFF
jgi:hypothetical protein